MRNALAAAALVALAVPLAAQEAEERPTPASIVAGAPAEDWLAIDPADLLVMTLAPDREGNPREVVIQLIPPPFSQPWVENIRTLARAHWWDGTSVNRVQDNYVTQWGDATEAKPLPEGVVSPEASYVVGDLLAIPDPRGRPRFNYNLGAVMVRSAILAASGKIEMPDEFAAGLEDETDVTAIQQMPEPELGDRYSALATFAWGWPIAGAFGDEVEASNSFWPVHCYGFVGVGRNLAPDTGTGAELYTIIGQPQRHMDRNLAVVGRVIEGMEHLSSLPRGHGELGFYAEDELHLRTPIVSVRLGDETGAFPPPRFEYLDTASESFAEYVRVRANRDDAFYTVPAGGVDVCSVHVPIRRAPSE